ncbi:MAG: tolC [Candidatus Saganbacteria bacterium]|uniref:TolC n=1 Tax=Candidatus Saganbacteria bacterium TaxID=2575572 RepID=A0A833L0H9_UNCSA|nr:MAG: tolC [Candidatus Saganbacteria bacterium]
MRKTFIGSSVVFLMLFLPISSFGLTLDESISFAVKNNPAVLSAQKKAAAAQAKLGQAVGAFLPTIKLEGTVGKSYTQPSVIQMASQYFTFGTDAATESKTITVSFAQPLFMASLIPGFSLAKKYTEIAREDLKKTINDTSFNVTQAYFAVLKARIYLKLAQDSKEMAQSHLNQVRMLLAAQVSTKADYLRTEVQLANAEIALTKAKSTLDIAEAAFNNSLGKNIEEMVVLSTEQFKEALPALPNYKNLLEITFTNRPEWKQYELSKGITEDNLRINQTAYLPSLLVSGQTGNRISEYPTYKSDVNSWSITGIASWTIFDGFGLQNRIREAAANVEAQKAAEEQVKNGIELEVRDAYFSLKSAIETISSAKKAVESAEENYKVSDTRFNSGVGTNLEVIDAQVALTQAKINYLQALFDVEIGKARINKVVGKEII